jgi:TM2 domain-containing membrane protein YozV
LATGTKQCPNCNRNCTGDDLFCASCGYRFPEVSPVAQSGSALVCSVCGYRRSSFDTTCPQCAKSRGGEALQTSVPSVPPAPYAPPQLPAATNGYSPFPTPMSPPAPGQMIGQVPHIQCFNCHQWVAQGLPQCPYCTAILSSSHAGIITNPQAPVQQVVIQNVIPSSPYGSMVPYRPRKDKTATALLAILLGTFGAQRFYLGQTGRGILSLLFCWTYIPALIGLIEGIVYLCMDEQEFHRRHG